VRVRPDIVFTKQRLAIFVDGCFFHACPTHGTRPRQNVQYWEQKLERNVLRDRRVTEALREERWTVIRLWEHQPTDEGLKIVMEVLQRS
jgi:DNA mismatch endonuclease (patch repair protein)